MLKFKPALLISLALPFALLAEKIGLRARQRDGVWREPASALNLKRMNKAGSI